MHNVTAEVVYQSLGKLLDQISRSAEVKNSPKTAEKVRNAIAFHQELEKELSALVNENQNLKQELQTVIGLANVNGCVEEPKNLYRKYEEMKLSGASVDKVYAQTQKDKLDRINTLKVLRRVFDLSLEDAMQILETNESTKIAA